MLETLNTVDEGFSWFESFTNLEKNLAGATREFRLDRMIRLVGYFGDPHKSFKLIHTAGSKGKGSTSAFIASGINIRGYTTGLYTSPHVTNYRERISLVGKPIPESVYLENMREIFDKMKTLLPEDFPGSGEPTTFELLTLLAFMVFRRLNCDWVVLETGLGGRLDATNIVTPEATIITHIELEHTAYLGNTVELIAAEKGGIIKKGVPVFGGKLVPGPAAVIRNMAAERMAPLLMLDDVAKISTAGRNRELTRVLWDDGSVSEWKLKMAGPHQGENAALAALVLKSIFTETEGYPEKLLRTALEKTSLPGRMERFKHRGSIWILDGAHTSASLRLTVTAFCSLYGDNGILLFGSSLGKPLSSLVRETVVGFRDIIVTRAGNFKPEDPEKIYNAFYAVISSDQKLHLEPDPLEAYKSAVALSKGDRPVLITGSFYMAGEIRTLLL